jgi:hypothetical protein
MSQPSLPKKVAVEVLEALGWDHDSPIARTVLVTALDGLSRDAKDDLIRFLSARPMCACGAASDPDYTNGDHDDGCPAKMPTRETPAHVCVRCDSSFGVFKANYLCPTCSND